MRVRLSTEIPKKSYSIMSCDTIDVAGTLVYFSTGTLPSASISLVSSNLNVV